MRKKSKDWNGKHLAISVFILAQSAMVLSFTFPVTSWLRNVNDAVSRYLMFFGFDQTYAVFVKPRKINKHLSGFIVYKSGLTELYDYPRVEQYGFLEKIRFERYRKFFSDNLDTRYLEDGKADLARYIARTHNVGEDPPCAISLWLVTIPIPPPDGSECKPRTIAPFIDYTVQETDLQ
ncbi:MAG TPA: hypothetical protein V6C86_04995 [Oculatellaceae cyanobacterium]